jgi:Carboxypeptidase regulatory-like domain
MQRLCLISLLLLGAAQAQVFRGSIQGAVTDGSGAVVGSAIVKATQIATGQSYSTLTSSAGEYVVADLPLGEYAITVSQPGFENLKVNGVTVSAGAVYNLPLKLTIAKMSSTVEVSAAAVSLDTTTVAQTNAVPNVTVQSLPVNGRNFTQLVALAPGFAGYGGSGSFNGSRSGGINQQIEGIDNNDAANNSSAANQGGIQSIPGVLMPLDAIEEFSVQSHGGAEVGRNSGAVVNLIIKSGTNQVHGTGYYYNRNEALSANSPFAAPSTPKLKLRNQHYGTSLGGPIRHDKTFFFMTFERQQFIIGQRSLTTQPSYAYQATAESLMVQYGVAVNPVSVKLLNMLWPANVLNGPATPNNYFATTPETGFSNNGLAKLDHSFNDKNRLALRWYVGQGTQTAPLSSFIPDYYQVGPMHVHNYSAILNTTITASIANQALIGVNYFHQAFHDANTSADPTAAGFVTGITGSNLSGSPNFNISGFDPTGLSPVSGRQDYTSHAGDTISMIRGKHQIRLGGEVRRVQLYEIGAGAGNNWGGRGNFTINGQMGPWSSLLSVRGQDTNILSLADFLAGYVYSSTIIAGNVGREVSQNALNLYVQDSWQVSRKLNLSLGLRWDSLSPLGDDRKDLSVFRPSVPGGLAVVGDQVSGVYPTSKKMFAPRLGAAWQINDGLVLRSGFGLFWDTPSGNTFLAQGSLSNNGAIGIDANPVGSRPVYAIARSGYNFVANQPIFPSTLAIAGNNIFGLFSVSPDFKPGDTMNFDLNLEKTLGKNILVQAGYVGAMGRHLAYIRDINQAALGSNSVNKPLNGFSYLQQTRPYFSQFPNFGAIDELGSGGNSSYHSLQTLIRFRTWHGLTSQYSYTWSHALETLSSSSTLPQDSTNVLGDYGNGANDVRHQFKGYVVYDVPGAHRGPHWLTHGWQFNSLLYLRTGRPVTIRASSATSGTLEGTERANIIGDPYAGVSHAFVQGQTVRWYNPAAFVNPAAGQFGSMQKNSLYGPGFATIDFSVFKNIPIRERLKAQVRAEVFNIFNRVNLGNPSARVGSSLGIIGGTVGGAGQPGIGPGEPFNMQLALKMVF